MSMFAKPVAPQRRDINSFPWYDEYFRSSESGETVTRYTAMQSPAVWRCVSLVQNLLGEMPIDVYMGDQPDPLPTDRIPQLLADPSYRVSRAEWISQYVAGMMLEGNAYGIVTSESSLGIPTGIEWLSHNRMTVQCEHQLSVPVYYYQGQLIPPDKVVHIRNVLLPGCIEGLSPIEYHAESIGLNLAARKFGARWFGDGAHPTAILSTDARLDQEQAQQMKQRFLASVRGKREPAVMGAGIKYTAIQTTAGEAQFLETLTSSVSDIARVFGIPVEMIGGAADGGTTQTYANREQRWADFIATVLHHYAARLESVLTDLLPASMWVKFNLDALLRGDTMARYDAYSRAITAGFMSTDEVRELEDLKPLPAVEPSEPEVVQALQIVAGAPTLAQNPGLVELVDQLRELNGKPRRNPKPDPATNVQMQQSDAGARSFHAKAPEAPVTLNLTLPELVLEDRRTINVDVAPAVVEMPTIEVRTNAREKVVERDATGQIVRTVERDV